jgi:hypothetical protein
MNELYPMTERQKRILRIIASHERPVALQYVAAKLQVSTEKLLQEMEVLRAGVRILFTYEFEADLAVSQTVAEGKSESGNQQVLNLTMKEVRDDRRKKAD